MANLKVRHTGRVTLWQWEKAHELKDRGFSTKDIAAFIHCGESTAGRLSNASSFEEYKEKARISNAKYNAKRNIPKRTQQELAVSVSEEADDFDEGTDVVRVKILKADFDALKKEGIAVRDYVRDHMVAEVEQQAIAQRLGLVPTVVYLTPQARSGYDMLFPFYRDEFHRGEPKQLETMLRRMSDYTEDAMLDRPSVSMVREALIGGLSSIKTEVFRLLDLPVLKDEHGQRPATIDPKSDKAYGNKDINDMFGYWEKSVGFPISAQVQRNRFSCSNLIKKHGVARVQQMIDTVARAKYDKYGPRISDFSELQMKLNQLVAWAQREQLSKTQATEGKS